MPRITIPLALVMLAFASSTRAAPSAAGMSAPAASAPAPAPHYQVATPPGWKEVPADVPGLPRSAQTHTDHVFTRVGPSGALQPSPLLFIATLSNDGIAADPDGFAFGLQHGITKGALQAGSHLNNNTLSFDPLAGRIVSDYMASRDGIIYKQARDLYVLGRQEIIEISLSGQPTFEDADRADQTALFKTFAFNAGFEPLSPAAAADAPASRRIDTPAHHYQFNLPAGWTRFPPLPPSGSSPLHEDHLLLTTVSPLREVPLISISWGALANPPSPAAFAKVLEDQAELTSPWQGAKSWHTEVSTDPATGVVIQTSDIQMDEQPPLRLQKHFFIGREGIVVASFADHPRNLPLHQPAFDALLKTLALDPGYDRATALTRASLRLWTMVGGLALGVLLLVGLVVAVVAFVRRPARASR